MSSKIFLYQAPSVQGDSEALEEYLGSNFGVQVERRGDFFSFFDFDLEATARKLAELRVTDITSSFQKNDPLPMEVKVEERALEGKKQAVGVLYDGFALMEFLKGLMPREEVRAGYLHLYITERLLGTFGQGDRRYHARAIVLGYPSIISTPGLVEAPARPREYYLEKGTGIAPEILKDKYSHQFLDYGDERMTEVLKGYASMATFYQFFGEAFCSDKNCRLYNAHWQEELLRAQLSRPGFCNYHEGLRKSLVKGG